ncbi:MAG TPA: TIGR03790 family protein [Candidatus Wunengus sp. YC60]|uniref:TIGR03790 family protein n=1 Tax=Candidatus Wunengus sp. YC60 TaxID=3367697 RepID=UPI004026D439
MKRATILFGFILFVFVQSVCFNQRFTIAEEWSSWKNFYGIYGIDTPANHAKYAKQMGYDSIVIKNQWLSNYVSTYRNNSDLSGLKFYLANPHMHYRVMSSHGSTIDTTSTYTQTNQDFYNQNMVWKSNDTFPNNLATGWFGSSTSFQVLWDFQQQSVIDSVVENIITYAKSLEDQTTGFTFGGYMIDTPILCGNFFKWDSTQNKNVRTNLTYWTGADSGLVHDAITHDYSTYSDGVAAFYKKLNTRMRQDFGTVAKWILEPWKIYSEANGGKEDEWVYQVKSRTDYTDLTPDMITAQAGGVEFVDDTRNFNSGPNITKDMAGITQRTKVGEYDNRLYAAKAGVNGAWYNWFARFGDSGDMSKFQNITEVYPRLKLVRCIPNWDNLNSVPLANRSWDGSVYQSTKSYISSDVLYSRHPKTGKLFAVFLTTNGIIKLNAGETVTSVQYTDGYFIEGGDGSGDVNILGSEISLKSSVSIDKDTNGEPIGKGYIITISTGGVPTAITMSATDITSNSATLNGTANANGLSTTVWFEYSAASGSYTNQSSTQNISGYGDSSLSAGISGLSPATTYYYRIAAQNSAGTAYGNEMSFTTSDSTAPVGSISINGSSGYTNTNSITLTLSATDDVGVTGYYLSAGNSTPLSSDSGWVSVTSASSYSSSVSYSLGSGDGTKLVYAWFKDASGNISGAVSAAITLDTSVPSITITSPTSSSTYTTTNSTINLGGSSSDNTSGVKSVTWSNSKGGTGTANGTAIWSISSINLSAGENAITLTAKDGANNAGTNTITVCYGTVPTVITGSATSITQSAATLNGTVTTNGLLTTVRFEYGTVTGSYSCNSTSQSINGTISTAVSSSISGFPSGSTYYYRVVAQNSAGSAYGSEKSFSRCVTGSITAHAKPENVLVVVNDNSQASKDIASYYQSKRNIPDMNIMHYTGTTTETVSSTEYSNLTTAIKNWITNKSLQSKIDYIVLTKGTPLKTSNDGNSVASKLVCMDTQLPECENNPYYFKDETFSHQKSFGGNNLYLVTRLDGYTVDQVKTLIDNSVNAKGYVGTFLFDGKGTNYIQETNMSSATDGLNTAGFSATCDRTTTFLTGKTDLMGYFSWGSNAGGDYTLSKYQNNSFLPGSLGETYVSTGGRTFNLPANWPNYSGQSLVADLIIKGITGVSGYVSEPYLSAMVNPNFLFNRYTKGYNLAESYYMSIVYVNWRTVVIGDPLCAPYAVQ